MKNTSKGFTLIELLAVIVILAIISLISTPIVMNIIEDSKKGAAERSTDNYIDAVETKVGISLLDSENKIDDGLYNIDIDGNICSSNLNSETGKCPEEFIKTIEMNGTKPARGTIVIENGRVVNKLSTDNTKATSIGIGAYTVAYDTETNKYVATKSETGESTTKVCTLKNGEALAIGSEYECTVSATETQTFYVLEDGDSENATEATEAGQVSLIMNQNIDNTTVAYCDPNGPNPSNGLLCKADGAKAKLIATTNLWTNVDKVSLPTGQQIANASGITIWTDGETPKSGLPTWLSGNLNFYSPPTGYWTSTPSTSYYISAWYVHYYGELSYELVRGNTISGVRPVITVLKSKI